MYQYIVKRLSETSTQVAIAAALHAALNYTGALRTVAIIVGVIGAVLPTTTSSALND